MYQIISYLIGFERFRVKNYFSAVSKKTFIDLMHLNQNNEKNIIIKFQNWGNKNLLLPPKKIVQFFHASYYHIPLMGSVIRLSRT